MRADLVVVASPVGDHVSGLCERREPVLVEALITELAVEALDVAVLRRTARLDQDVFDAMPLRPGDERAAGELGAIVRAHGWG